MEGQQEVLARPVAAVMRPVAVTVDVGETVLVAWELLQRSGSHQPPVVRSDGRCVGLLDRADVALAGHPARKEPADRWPQAGTVLPGLPSRCDHRGAAFA
jgi:CBS-domain-containing membrane protein